MDPETIAQGDVSNPDTDETLASEAFGEEVEGNAEPAEVTQDEQGDTPADAQDESEGSIDNLADYLKTAELDPEQFMRLKYKVKVDGEETDVPLADIVKAYQLEGHVNKKSIELSEQRKAFEAESGKVQKEWADRVAFASQIINGQEAQLQQQYQSIDWNTLSQQDPQQYSALYLQFQQAAQQVQAQKSTLQQHWEQQRTQVRDAMQPKALEAIHAKYPEMRDPVAYGNAVGEIKSYLKGIGAGEDSMESIELDPLIFQVARDAARYHALSSKQPGISAKLKAAPKMEKPGAKDGFGSKQARLNALRKRADSGDEAAVAELLFSS